MGRSIAKAPDDEARNAPCDTCPLRLLPFCLAAIGEPGDAAGGSVQPRHAAVGARQTIYRKRQKSADVILIREGWAFRFAISASGRRQILSILLPGDILSTTSIFKERLPFSIQTMTPLSYCTFDRMTLLHHLEKDPGAMKIITMICVDERERCDRQLIDLVTRPAEERVVLLMLDLHARMEELGLAGNRTFPFPLTQQQLGDAVGLTQVHVNRVLRRLKQDAIVEISGGRIRIGNLAAMRNIVQMQ